jgi:hypothetical protein
VLFLLYSRILGLPHNSVVCEVTLMVFLLQINSFIRSLLVFIWVCGFHNQPHLVLLELHESRVMDLIEPYLAQVFLLVVVLRNYDEGFFG